jgi:hypothetical protein
MHHGDDDRADGDAPLERQRLVERGLSDAGVRDEDHQVGGLTYGLRGLLHLLEQRRLLFVAPARVHDDQVVALRVTERLDARRPRRP